MPAPEAMLFGETDMINLSIGVLGCISANTTLTPGFQPNGEPAKKNVTIIRRVKK